MFLQYPMGVVPAEMTDPLRAAAVGAGVSLWVNGIDPGFANDWLPLVITGISERIEEVRCLEILNYATYDQPMVMFDIMGFGRPLDDVPMLLLPGVLTMAWGSVVRQIAAGLDVELDSVEEFYERLPAPRSDPIASGTVDKGTAAGLRFEVRGMRGGRPVSCSSTSPGSRDDIGPDWPQPAGHGGYRVVVRASPPTPWTSSSWGPTATTTPDGLKATAMRLVNAVPAVVQASPGLVTALDLPLITGRGLVV